MPIEHSYDHTSAIPKLKGKKDKSKPISEWLVSPTASEHSKQGDSKISEPELDKMLTKNGENSTEERLAHRSFELKKAEPAPPENFIAKKSETPGEQDSSFDSSMFKFWGNVRSSNKPLEEPTQYVNESSNEDSKHRDQQYFDVSYKLLKLVNDSSDEKAHIIEVCKKIANVSEGLIVDNTELRKINEEWRAIHAKRDFQSKFQGKIIRTQELQLQAQRVNFKAVKDLLKVRRKNGTNAIDPDVKQALERVADAGVVLSSIIAVPKGSIETRKLKEQNRIPSLRTTAAQLTHEYPEQHVIGTVDMDEDETQTPKPTPALSDEELLMQLSERFPELKIENASDKLLAFIGLKYSVTTALQSENENEDLRSRPARLEAKIAQQRVTIEELSKEVERLNNDDHRFRTTVKVVVETLVLSILLGLLVGKKLDLPTKTT